MQDYFIFNHFVGAATEMVLVPECRSIFAPDMPGFTCGSDPSLRKGTKIVVRGVPETGYANDNRQVKLLKADSYNDLSAALLGQSECPNHQNNYCATIDHFKDGCGSNVGDSSDAIGDFVVFDNPFNQPDCAPNVTHITSNDSLMDEYKLYLGYDDLLVAGYKADSHRIYEISCKVDNTDRKHTTLTIEQGDTIDDHEDEIKTNFKIETFIGDEFGTDESNPLTGVFPFTPNADRYKRFQFKISSDHPLNYVHLETCSLSAGSTEPTEFINDGCVTGKFAPFFSNMARNSSAINEDWFYMRPILEEGSCKSIWQIDCTVSSCKRGVQSAAYEEFCNPGECDRYKVDFLRTNARKRRDTSSDSLPAEAHVKSNIVHPCFHVDEQTPQYCVDIRTCWTLQQCAAAFPNDFPNTSFPEPGSESDLELHQIMEEFEAAVQEHIQKKLTENQAVAHDHIMASIRDNANRVLDSKQTFEDAVEEIIRLINTL